MFEYEDPVVKYWPEFGKDETTIADVMRHEAGLPKLPPFQADSLTTEAIKKNSIGSVFEQTK